MLAARPPSLFPRLSFENPVVDLSRFRWLFEVADLAETFHAPGTTMGWGTQRIIMRPRKTLSVIRKVETGLKGKNNSEPTLSCLAKRG